MQLRRLVVPLVVLGAGWLTVPSSAAPETLCSQDATFCVATDIAVVRPGTETPATIAGEPADLVASANNTSTGHMDTADVWLKTLTLSFVNPLGGDVYTPSAQLDNGLLVAGTAAGCGPGGDDTFSDCSAGHGTAYVNVTGTSGIEDGLHAATFGIQRIDNVNPPASGAALDWVVTARVCVNSVNFGNCFGGAQTQQFEVLADGSTVSAGSVTLDTTIAGQYDFDTGFSTVHVTYNGAIDTVALHLLGESDQTTSGDAPSGNQRVIHMPTRCGTAAARVTGEDRAGAIVSLSRDVTVTGCPTARHSARGTAPYVAAFDGSASTVGTSGRTLSKWRWSFGDGTSSVRTGPTVSHRYANSHDRTVRLVVQDSLGALSPARNFLLKGTTLTILSKASAVPGTKVGLSGRLTRWHTTHGLAGRTLRLERCRANGTHCSLIKSVTTSSTGRWATKAVFRATKPKFRISYRGGAGTLGTRATRTVQRA